MKGILDIDGIRRIVLASNETYQAILLSMLAGGMGVQQFEEFNLYC